MVEFDPKAWPVLAVYCLLLVGASLAGGWLPRLLHLTHRRLQTAISFVAGLMLGMGLLHLLPHAAFELDSVDRAVQWALVGFLFMFLLQRFLHYHHHDLPEEDPDDECGCGHHHEPAPAAAPAAPPADDHAHSHDAHAHTLAAKSARQLSWVGTAIGLGLHSLTDGLALAAAVAAETKGEAHGIFFGIGAALAIILHKPFDSMAIFTLMGSQGTKPIVRNVVNFLFALIAPLGVALFFLGVQGFSGSAAVFIGTALAFSGGVFLCIACSDLLPELQFHSHDRMKLTLALAAGIGVAALIGKFELCGHAHEGGSHAHPPAAETKSGPH
jgi:zinc and cadmium transporter